MTYVTVLDNIPAKLTAGVSVSWSVSFSDYPASESWELTYTLIKSDTRIQIVGSADGEDHLIEIAKAVTANYAVGEYEYQAHVSNGTERYQVEAGIIEVVTDFATQESGYDARSDNKKILDALSAAIVGRADKTQMTQSVGGIQVQHMTLDEQIRLQAKFQARVHKENVAAGKVRPRRTIKTRFV